jgi:hypothetical protein
MPAGWTDSRARGLSASRDQWFRRFDDVWQSRRRTLETSARDGFGRRRSGRHPKTLAQLNVTNNAYLVLPPATLVRTNACVPTGHPANAPPVPSPLTISLSLDSGFPESAVATTLAGAGLKPKKQ